MCIENGIHQISQSPRGATCDSGVREETLTQRRKERSGGEKKEGDG